jgi:hypothetical protein
MPLTRTRRTTPLSAIVRGILAGAIATAAMTAHQEIRQRMSQRGEQLESEKQSPARDEPDPWQSAPAPAQVGKRLIEGVLGQPVPADAIPRE